MKLNGNELLIGGIYGLCFIFLIGYWAIPVAISSSILWAIGGRFGHKYRVFGVPICSYGAVISVTHNWWAIVPGVLTGAILSIGYGIPDVIPPFDEGSALGRFWFKVFKGNAFLANLFTRGTIYGLLLTLMCITGGILYLGH